MSARPSRRVGRAGNGATIGMGWWCALANLELLLMWRARNEDGDGSRADLSGEAYRGSSAT